MKTFKEYLLDESVGLKIYVDMDGVVADFVEYMESVTGEKIDQLTKDDVAFKKIKQKLTAGDFFSKLKPMKGLKLLKDFQAAGVDYEILSSVGKFNSANVANQKKAWLKKHLGFAPKFNYTTSSVDKAKYAKPNTVLIDDRTKSTGPFKSAGGQVILHKTYEDTKKKIDKLLKDHN
jgi:hypothetical protein